MTIKSQLQTDLQEAIRAQDEVRKSVIRLTLAAITNAEVEKLQELDDAETVAVLRKEARKREETIAELKTAGRPEQLERELAQRAVLSEYLPAMMTRSQIAARAQKVIEDTGADNLGQVMRVLMPELRGQADGRVVNEVVRELLSG